MIHPIRLAQDAPPPPDDGGGLLDGISDAISDAMGSFSIEWPSCILNPVDCVMEGMADQVASTSTSLTAWTIDAIENTTTPDYTVAWYLDLYGTVWGIQVWLLVGVFLLAIMSALSKGAGTAGLRRVVVGAGLSQMGAALALPMVAALTGAVWWAASAVMTSAPEDVGAAFGQVGEFLTPDVSPMGGILLLIIVLGGVLIVMMLLAWVALIAVKALLFLTPLVALLLMLGWVWPSGGPRRLPTRAIAAIAAISLTPLVMAMAFTVAAGMLGAAAAGAEAGSPATALEWVLTATMATGAAVAALPWLYSLFTPAAAAAAVAMRTVGTSRQAASSVVPAGRMGSTDRTRGVEPSGVVTHGVSGPDGMDARARRQHAAITRDVVRRELVRDEPPADVESAPAGNGHPAPSNGNGNGNGHRPAGIAPYVPDPDHRPSGTIRRHVPDRPAPAEPRPAAPSADTPRPKPAPARGPSDAGTPRRATERGPQPTLRRVRDAHTEPENRDG